MPRAYNLANKFSGKYWLRQTIRGQERMLGVIVIYHILYPNSIAPMHFLYNNSTVADFLSSILGFMRIKKYLIFSCDQGNPFWVGPILHCTVNQTVFFNQHNDNLHQWNKNNLFNLSNFKWIRKIIQKFKINIVQLYKSNLLSWTWHGHLKYKWRMKLAMAPMPTILCMRTYGGILMIAHAHRQQKIE